MKRIVKRQDVIAAQSQVEALQAEIARLSEYKSNVEALANRANKTTEQLELENKRRYAQDTSLNASNRALSATNKANTYKSDDELKHFEKVALSYATRDNSLRALYVSLVNAQYSDAQIVKHVCVELQKSNEKQVLRQLAFIRKHL
jgi:hypothetical protein